jgi:hypothetical protein
MKMHELDEGLYRSRGSSSAYDRDEQASKQGFGSRRNPAEDESNLLYIYKNERVQQAMISNHHEREARDQGYRDTPEQALKMHGIIKSKFKPGKWIQKQGNSWTEVYPFGKPEDVSESATIGATSSANIGTVDAPHLSPGKARGKKSYIGSPGKSGSKAPPQPKVNQPKNKDGTAKNGLDIKGASLFGGPPIKRR